MTASPKDYSWKVVYRATTVLEAQGVRLLLARSQIPAEIWDQHLNALHPWLHYALGGVRVVVPDDRYAEAQTLLKNPGEVEGSFSDEELTREAMAAVPPVAAPPGRKRRRWAVSQNAVLAFILAVLLAAFLAGIARFAGD